jgi:hypothetical protein
MRPPELARAGSLNSVATGRSHRSPGSRPFVPGVVHKAVHRCGLPTEFPHHRLACVPRGPRAWRASESRSLDVAAWRGCPALERYTGVRVAASGRSDLGVCPRESASAPVIFESWVVPDGLARLAWLDRRARPGTAGTERPCRPNSERRCPEDRKTTRKTRGSEAHLPAQHQEAGEESRLQAPDVDARRTSNRPGSEAQRSP